MNLDTEFVLCKQQIHHKVANIPLIRVPNMANISIWSSPTLHRSALNIAEFLHFISQNAFVKNKFASYLALKSTKLCDCSLVFLSPFLEIYYSNSIKWPTSPLSLLQALTPPFDPHHNLNSQFSALQYVLQFTKLLLPSKLLQAPPLPHATLRFNSNLPLSFLLFLKIAISIYQMANNARVDKQCHCHSFQLPHKAILHTFVAVVVVVVVIAFVKFLHFNNSSKLCTSSCFFPSSLPKVPPPSRVPLIFFPNPPLSLLLFLEIRNSKVIKLEILPLSLLSSVLLCLFISSPPLCLFILLYI